MTGEKNLLANNEGLKGFSKAECIDHSKWHSQCQPSIVDEDSQVVIRPKPKNVHNPWHPSKVGRKSFFAHPWVMLWLVQKPRLFDFR